MATPSPPPPREQLPTRIPQKASSFSAQLWAQSVGERIQLLLDPKPETAANFIRAGIESFDVQDLAVFIHTDRDLIPLLYEWMQLDDKLVAPWAKSIIRIWWPQIFAAAMNPAQLLEDIRRHDPAKAAVLDIPKGRAWFNWTIFNLLTFFRAYAEIKGDGIIQPPPNLPDRLRRLALEGAVTVIERVRRRS